jgi:hypothetical protein
VKSIPLCVDEATAEMLEEKATLLGVSPDALAAQMVLSELGLYVADRENRAGWLLRYLFRQRFKDRRAAEEVIGRVKEACGEHETAGFTLEAVPVCGREWVAEAQLNNETRGDK